MATIHRIVLTGGPCGGKSTALAKVSDRLSTLGFRVFQVPEAPTTLFQGGASLREASPEQQYVFQSNLLRLQLALEDTFLALARSTGEPSVLLLDRGALDIYAYVSSEMWVSILREQGQTAQALRDDRYDAVIHLTTAAQGAGSFYSTGNHTARTETPEEAQAIDRRLLQAYAGHRALYIIDNSTDFAGKIRRVFEAICQITGIPRPVPTERKYLLRNVPSPFPVRAEVVDIEQTYLKATDGSEARVRSRSQRGHRTYVHTLRRPRVDGQRVELERLISAREYSALLAQGDPARRTLKKRRTCFVWQGQYFELDEFVEPCSGLYLLAVELDQPDREVSLPPFLEVERE
ncbi:MAG: AAA family ATPase, partial [Myxococcales bacterium]|nr:AAA family ATPase [Myxococcales bacterium]